MHGFLNDTIDEIKDYFLKKRIISPNILLKYINGLIIENNLEEYFDEIIINQKKGTSYYSDRHLKNKKILSIDYLSLIKILESKNYNDIFIDKNDFLILSTKNYETIINGKFNNCDLLNILLLSIVHHEFQHVNQYKLLKNEELYSKANPLFVMSLVKSMLILFLEYDRLYCPYHDSIMNEYNAAYFEGLKTIELIETHFSDLIDDKAINTYNRIITKYILYGYIEYSEKTFHSSPVRNTQEIYDIYLKKMKDFTIEAHIPFYYTAYAYAFENISNSTNKDCSSLENGLDIDMSTRSILFDVYKQRTKTLNLYNQIKR